MQRLLPHGVFSTPDFLVLFLRIHPREERCNSAGVPSQSPSCSVIVPLYFPVIDDPSRFLCRLPHLDRPGFFFSTPVMLGKLILIYANFVGGSERIVPFFVFRFPPRFILSPRALVIWAPL